MMDACLFLSQDAPSDFSSIHPSVSHQLVSSSFDLNCLHWIYVDVPSLPVPGPTDAVRAGVVIAHPPVDPSAERVLGTPCCLYSLCS